MGLIYVLTLICLRGRMLAVVLSMSSTLVKVSLWQKALTQTPLKTIRWLSPLGLITRHFL